MKIDESYLNIILLGELIYNYHLDSGKLSKEHMKSLIEKAKEILDKRYSLSLDINYDLEESKKALQDVLILEENSISAASKQNLFLYKSFADLANFSRDKESKYIQYAFLTVFLNPEFSSLAKQIARKEEKEFKLLPPSLLKTYQELFKAYQYTLYAEQKGLLDSSIENIKNIYIKPLYLQKEKQFSAYAKHKDWIINAYSFLSERLAEEKEEDLYLQKFYSDVLYEAIKFSSSSTPKNGVLTESDIELIKSDELNQNIYNTIQRFLTEPILKENKEKLLAYKYHFISHYGVQENLYLDAKKTRWSKEQLEEYKQEKDFPKYATLIENMRNLINIVLTKNDQYYRTHGIFEAIENLILIQATIDCDFTNKDDINEHVRITKERNPYYYADDHFISSVLFDELIKPNEKGKRKKKERR